MDPQELSAQELVQLCLGNNQRAAWEEFVRRYQPTIASAVKQTARHWTMPQHALVDDLVHDTYLKLMANNCRALRELQLTHENAIFGFLRTVASHIVTDHFRGTRNKKRSSGKEDISLDDPDVFAPLAGGSGLTVEQEIMFREIDTILKSFSSEPNFVRDYCIFWLYYRYGFTAKAIASLSSIDLEVKGVESALLRLIKLVRSKMGGRSSGTAC